MNADQFLQEARRSFGLAGEAKDIKDVERHGADGHDYLQRALVAARQEKAEPSLWSNSHV